MARRLSSITAVGLASLALTPAALAQTSEATPAIDSEYSAAAQPTPTPTVSPTPTPVPSDEGADVGDVGEPPEDASKRVRRVYRDFRRDAIIEPCDHTLYVLRQTRDTVPEDFDVQYPDFLESVKAAIAERKELDCEEVAEEQDPDEDSTRDQDAGGGEDSGSEEGADADDGGSTGGGGFRTPSTPAPIDPLPIDPVPSSPGDMGSDVAPDPLPPVETVAPLPEPVTPPPAAQAPVPAPVAPPVATPAPSTVKAEPATAPAPVWGLAAGGGLLALGGLLAPLFGARGGARLAAFEHAWGEAGFRVRGAWQDFRDWLRVGR